MKVPAYYLFNFKYTIHQLNEYLISNCSETNGRLFIIMKVSNVSLALPMGLGNLMGLEICNRKLKLLLNTRQMSSCY